MAIDMFDYSSFACPAVHLTEFLARYSGGLQLRGRHLWPTSFAWKGNDPKIPALGKSHLVFMRYMARHGSIRANDDRWIGIHKKEEHSRR
jgi:hypothetical protein